MRDKVTRVTERMQVCFKSRVPSEIKIKQYNTT